MDGFGSDIWAELDAIAEGVRGIRLVRPRGATLATSVWELDPGATSGDYHFHHGSEEMLVVLRGRPTLRTAEGDRMLEEGEVVHFGRGPEGSHQVGNRSEGTVRYLMIAAHSTPEVIEYPDRGTLVVMARTASQLGEPLFSFHRLVDAFERDEEEADGDAEEGQQR